MRLLIIRHGDPNYEIDSLTETGWKEANLLVDRLRQEDITQFYVSPLGRAQDTAKPTLEALGRTAIELDWLREFPAVVDVNGSEFLQRAYPQTGRNEDGTYQLRHVCWDMVPGCWTPDDRNFDRNAWRETPSAQAGDMAQVYDYVCDGLDTLLAEHGYVRTGNMYTTEQGNHETLVFFCHFGLASILLSHLWNISPVVLSHCLALAPTSVSEIWTEERIKGEVYFRASRLGDVSHLYAAGRTPSFSARFCETYEDFAQRH